MRVDEGALASLMRQQEGLIERGQAMALGLSDRQIARMVGGGRWAALQAGVYADAASPGSWQRDILAATLAGGPEVVASHRAAGRAWGLDGCLSDVVEITTPNERNPRVVGAIVHRTTRWFPPDLSRCGVIPVTSVARTLTDLGAVVHRKVVAAAVEHALRKGLVSERLLLWRLEEAGGRGCRGAGVLRAVLEDRPEGGPAGSRLEVVAIDLIRRYELPLPRRQVEVRIHGRRYVLDLAYVSAKIAIEIDGFDTHGTRAAFVSDIRRQNDLVLAGWTILRFTWDDIVNRPEAVAQAIAHALRAATAAS